MTGLLERVKRAGSATRLKRPVLSSRGRCPVCRQAVTFASREVWLRDHYLCPRCGSVPRERALMSVLKDHFPEWRHLVVHESSPEPRGASQRLAAECGGYIPSQYFPDETPGAWVSGFRCENLESLTFPDESIDLHITQDVLEHVFHPGLAFREIARTLRPGGAHVFTVPLVNKTAPSRRRARLSEDGRVEHLEPPIYHGNPISDDGALVTVDWGTDICRHIFDASGLFTKIVHIDDLSRGIRAEYIEVLITFKLAETTPAGGFL